MPELGKQFFVINNLDKSSGLINISYSGDPEKYIDCGNITSFVKNARGERTYNFPGAKASQQYEIMDSLGLFFIDRKMLLDGRVNLIFEEISPTQTRVTANTRYSVHRDQTIRTVVTPYPQVFSDNVSFNSGSKGQFPTNANGEFTECAPTGRLERDILSAIGK